IPSQQMVALGVQSYQQVLTQEAVSSNQADTRAIRQVGQRITAAVENYLREVDRYEIIKDYKWEFNLLKGDDINAFAIPGGKIAFYEGIMPICANDNGIAVVMAHEIAHAIADHANERMTQQLSLELGGVALSQALKDQSEGTAQLAMAAFGVGSQLGVILPYSRKHEQEADELGLYFMAMAGYDPREAPRLWERMAGASPGGIPEFLSTHPNPESRIKFLNRKMNKAMNYYQSNR
ncbi:MAG TPA: M48 family metallopeptidase, partial [Mariniphaga sp.]|nr:M48 family metallopeptidase [Mariniphaga sp.]